MVRHGTRATCLLERRAIWVPIGTSHPLSIPPCVRVSAILSPRPFFPTTTLPMPATPCACPLRHRIFSRPLLSTQTHPVEVFRPFHSPWMPTPLPRTATTPTLPCFHPRSVPRLACLAASSHRRRCHHRRCHHRRCHRTTDRTIDRTSRRFYPGETVFPPHSLLPAYLRPHTPHRSVETPKRDPRRRQMEMARRCRQENPIRTHNPEQSCALSS